MALKQIKMDIKLHRTAKGEWINEADVDEYYFPQSHFCPVCHATLEYLFRYPNYVCQSCYSKATDKDGRLLGFYNTAISGGFEALYLDTNEVYDSHICYIDGIECYADEARFGGIVIEKIVKQ
jgi:hypothetical protein